MGGGCFRSGGGRNFAAGEDPPACRREASGMMDATSPARTSSLSLRLRSTVLRPSSPQRTGVLLRRDRPSSVARRRANRGSAPASLYRPDDSEYCGGGRAAPPYISAPHPRLSPLAT